MFLHFLILGIQRYIRKLTTQAELKQENYKCNDTFPNGFSFIICSTAHNQDSVKNLPLLL